MSVRKTNDPINEPMEHVQDAIQFLRDVPIPDMKVLPKVPSGYKPLKPEEIKRLQKISEDNLAEAQAALDEIATNQEQYIEDFGTKPHPVIAVHLSSRLSEARQAVRETEARLAFLKAIEDVIIHDSKGFLTTATKDLDHAKTKDATVEGRHERLARYDNAVSKAISDGIAQAKTNKKASTQDPSGQPK